MEKSFGLLSCLLLENSGSFFRPPVSPFYFLFPFYHKKGHFLFLNCSGFFLVPQNAFLCFHNFLLLRQSGAHIRRQFKHKFLLKLNKKVSLVNSSQISTRLNYRDKKTRSQPNNSLGPQFRFAYPVKKVLSRNIMFLILKVVHSY